ncbi:MAG: heme lyase CcmF/NrfE family subunit [Thermomicrobiaceae bacterium]|nr:heme lyase CcmF/NrfE family subunit [Thermomicrobiaceae bacterium]
MPQLGHGALVVALALALYGIVAGVLGARRAIPELVDSAIRAVWGVTALILVAVVALMTAFLTHDFRLAYVAGRSSREMPTHYVLAAFYGGQEGSLLYWAMIAGILSSLAVLLHRRRDRALMPYMVATVLSVETFLLFMLTVIANPFKLMPVAPADGAGLNPLLRDPGMMMHPPFLLAGFSSFTVPFGFAMAALITGRLGDDWIRAIRRWALVAWGILGVGLILGAWWAYHVLGWGGYWGWDPVENVALLPWLTATAFLHSIIVQERRGMLKVWNMSLILASFILSVFGTFTVRAGLISSVHSFAVSKIGPWFLMYLGVVSVVAIALLLYRLPGLQSDRAIESVVSRESGFLLNNLLFAAMTFATLWGTVFPLFTELFRSTKLTVGPPFYDQVNGPIMLALLLLMGVGPLLAWRRSSGRALLRNLLWPGAAGVVATVVLAVATGSVLAAVGFGATVFAVGTIVLEYGRGAAVRRRNTGEAYPRAVAMLVRKNGRRYGGYIVHLAVAIMAAGIIGSHFFQVERQFTVKPGETASIGAYSLVYHGLDDRQTREGEAIAAKLTVLKNGESRGNLESYRFFYTNYEDQPTARMGIKTIGLDDVYVVLDRWENDGTASIRVFINPMVSWIWVGGLVYVLGTFTLLWPAPRPARQRAASPVREVVLREA